MNFSIFLSKSYFFISLNCFSHRSLNLFLLKFKSTSCNEEKLLFIKVTCDSFKTLIKASKLLVTAKFPLLTASKIVIPKLSLFVFKAR